MSKKYKSIIVTGSSRGLGSAIAKESGKQGYMYYGVSRWSDMDVSDIVSLTGYMKNIEETDNVCFPHALINNAGVCIPGNILEASQNDFDSQFGTNVKGIFNCSQVYAHMLIKNKKPGKIINIASTAGTGARAGRSIYAASKAAVINLSLSMAEELKSYGIKVYCICPGAFDSQLRRNIAPDDNFVQMMKPKEIARFIMKIINDDISYLDNQIIYIRK